MQSVITVSEQGAIAIAVSAVAAAAPPLGPPLIAAYHVYTYTHDAWHWHPMFSVMLAWGSVSAMVIGLFVLTFILPRFLAASILFTDNLVLSSRATIR